MVSISLTNHRKPPLRKTENLLLDGITLQCKVMALEQLHGTSARSIADRRHPPADEPRPAIPRVSVGHHLDDRTRSHRCRDLASENISRADAIHRAMGVRSHRMHRPMQHWTLPSLA